jgi:ubiquinone/menaquinone biosynthesis C-methylase UbiE
VESAANTARLAKFYGATSPSLDAVAEILAAAGVDPRCPRARDLYERNIDCHNIGMHSMLELLAGAASEFGLPTPDDTLLDVGCGIGGPGRFLAERFGCSVVGVDLVPLRIELARSITELTAMTDRISYRVADATELGLAAHSFAHVWMLDVSIHIRDKRALFSEIARVMQPGALLVMHDMPGPLAPAMRPVMREVPYIAPSLPQLIRYVEQAGLRVLAWRDTTSLALDFFVNMRDQVLGTPEPAGSQRQTGIPILDGYLETLAGQGGRTGMLVARRS